MLLSRSTSLSLALVNLVEGPSEAKATSDHSVLSPVSSDHRK